jgi:hypothetical protein
MIPGCAFFSNLLHLDKRYKLVYRILFLGCNRVPRGSRNGPKAVDISKLVPIIDDAGQIAWIGILN